jgi:ribosomal subunit interface protein
MHIDIHASHIELNATLRAFIEEKMSDVMRLLGDQESSARLRVEVGMPSGHHNKGEVFYAEANLQTQGELMRADSTHADMHSAIVEVKDKLQEQIVSMKERVRDSHRKQS